MNCFFKKKDLIIYFAVLAVIVLTFLIPILSKPYSKDGFNVFRNNELIFTYYINGDTYSVLGDFIEIEDGEVLTLKVYADENKTAFNVIKIDKNNDSVYVAESNCHSQDCVYSAPVKDGKGIIACLPHGIKIVPLKSGYKEITVG